MRYGYKLSTNRGTPIGYANGFKRKADAETAAANERRCGSYLDGVRVVRCFMTEAEFQLAF